MSCLTRNMQKQLKDYIKRNINRPWRVRPETLRDDFVSRGLCPSDVTADQFAVIIETIEH